jgi:hypothetical protein
MDENKTDEESMKFFLKLKKLIGLLDEYEDKCLLCEKITNRHVAIFGDSKDGSDLGLGSPKVGFRYGIAAVCEAHDLNDDDIGRQARIAIEIKKLANMKKIVYVGDANDIINDDEVEGLKM